MSPAVALLPSYASGTSDVSLVKTSDCAAMIGKIRNA